MRIATLLSRMVPRAYRTRQEPVNTDATFTCVAIDRNGVVWLGSDVGIFATDGAD